MIKPLLLQISSANPKVDHPSITPHPIEIVVRIDLEQQSPIGGPGFEFFGLRIIVAAFVSAIESVGDELAPQLHATHFMCMAKQNVSGLSRNPISR
jgi:hypothetical protein